MGGDVGVIFHAKEYPTDLGLKKRSSSDSGSDGGSEGAGGGGGSEAGGFDSKHPAYAARNLVWLASTNTIYVWRPPLYTKWEALLQLGNTKSIISIQNSSFFST